MNIDPIYLFIPAWIDSSKYRSQLVLLPVSIISFIDPTKYWSQPVNDPNKYWLQLELIAACIDHRKYLYWSDSFCDFVKRVANICSTHASTSANSLCDLKMLITLHNSAISYYAVSSSIEIIAENNWSDQKSYFIHIHIKRISEVSRWPTV